MDRIAVISDLHGNIPALEATLEDIRRRGIDQILCLGDLVGKGPNSAQVVDLCREACAITVRGNWDDFIVTHPQHRTAQWHREQLGAERIAYLAQLPYVIDFWISGKPLRLFHASQLGIYHRVMMNAPFELLLAMFNNTPFTGNQLTPSVVGYGDIHWAFVKCFQQRILFNVGSVGNPLDLTEASYAILEGHYHSQQPSPFAIQLMRVPYDIERAIHDAETMQMPDLQPYISELRTARYRKAAPAPTE